MNNSKPRRTMSIKRGEGAATDLDALIAGADPVAAAQETEVSTASISIATPSVVQKKKVQKKAARIGRKPRSSAQGRMTKKANVLFTDREWQELLKNAEDRPVGSFIRRKLKEAGIIS